MVLNSKQIIHRKLLAAFNSLFSLFSW